MTTISLRPRAVPASSRIRDLLHLTASADVLSLAGGLPAAGALDAEAVRAAAADALAAAGPLGPVALQYGPTEGLPALRELIAARHGVAPACVLVTAGSQQAIDLLVRATCGPGDRVAVEEPAYLGALQAIGAAGAEALPVPGDDEGMRVDLLEERLAAGPRPRLLYVVPSFHNPTGAVMPPERRERLVHVAARHGVPVVEDEAYVDLWADAPPPPPLAMAAEGVIRVGSVSKVLAPGLRVGWLIGPPALVAALARLKQAADLQASSFSQAVVLGLLADEAAHARRLRALRRRYRAQAAALSDALVRRLGDRVRFAHPSGGMFAWVTAADGTGADALLRRAVGHGVAFVPGPAFSSAGGCGNAMRLSFSSLGPEDLDRAVARLARAWEHGRNRGNPKSPGGGAW